VGPHAPRASGGCLKFDALKDALALAAPHLKNPVLKEEACSAAVVIAEKLAPNGDAQVTAVMKHVAKTTANKKLDDR
jgi:hypothetical protein